ncbi:MAG: YihY/virulence factor BrkB family protein [Nibricoccus sp.]
MRKMMQKSWPRILIDTAKAWNADNAFKHSAAVSFYTLFSMAPITIIVAAIAAFFLGKEQAQEQLHNQITALVGPASAELVSKAAEASQTDTRSTTAAITGVALLIVGATTVFAQLQDSLNSIWKVRTKPEKSGWLILIIQRLISFAMVLTVGFLLLVSLILTTALSFTLKKFSNTILGAPWVLNVADALGSLVVITALFALMFKVLPDVKLHWKEVVVGAGATSVLFTIGRYLIAFYLSHSTVASIYGTAGSLVALLVWVYYSCSIMFFGAEFIRIYIEAKGRPVEPKETAVRVKEEFIEDHPEHEIRKRA